jgi:hypothetical protein
MSKEEHERNEKKEEEKERITIRSPLEDLLQKEEKKEIENKTFISFLSLFFSPFFSYLKFLMKAL